MLICISCVVSVWFNDFQNVWFEDSRRSFWKAEIRISRKEEREYCLNPSERERERERVTRITFASLPSLLLMKYGVCLYMNEFSGWKKSTATG